MKSTPSPFKIDPATDEKQNKKDNTADLIPACNDQLTAELTRLAGHINAAEYRFLKLLAALIERNAWRGDSGMKTPAHWLDFYCGIDLGAAREKIRVARALENLPRIDAEFATGALSYSKVRAMTRCATPENEEFLLRVARYGTADHMEKLVRQHRRVKRCNEKKQGESVHSEQALSYYYDDDGMLVLNGRFAAEDGAVIVKALEAVMDAMVRDKSPGQEAASSSLNAESPLEEKSPSEERFPLETKILQDSAAQISPETFQQKRKEEEPAATVKEQVVKEKFDETEPELTFQRKRGNEESAAEVAETVTVKEPARDKTGDTELEKPALTFPQKRAEALLQMAGHVLACPDQNFKRLGNGDKYQVLVHLDLRQASETLKSSGTNTGYLEDGPPLSPATMERLLCDASLVPVLRDQQGNVLNIGRKTRAVPPAIQRALKIRDRGCRFPGCTQTRHVDAHHIRHWNRGGETSLDNLVLLCRPHHRLLHEGGFAIEKGSELKFIDRQGNRIPTAVYPQFTDQSIEPDGRLTVDIENAQNGLKINPATAVSLWQGEQMDYSLAVGVLQSREWAFAMRGND